MEINLNKLSKYFSYLLRHKPEAVGLYLDENGWASIEELIKKSTDFQLTRELVDIVVETNDKQRFSISDDGKRIKANQGHSIEIELDLKPIEPPGLLLHGTTVRFMESIKLKGLCKMDRHHVHLTESKAVAKSVGSRYGKPIILNIAALKMYDDGHSFYKTRNNIWLVEHVPFEYIVET